MPKCRVLEKSFINNSIVEPGTIVDYDPGPDGEIGPNLELVRGRRGATQEADAEAPDGGEAS